MITGLGRSPAFPTDLALLQTQNSNQTPSSFNSIDDDSHYHYGILVTPRPSRIRPGSQLELCLAQHASHYHVLALVCGLGGTVLPSPP